MQPDLFVVPEFFEPHLCETILGELKSLAGSAATVYGRSGSGSIEANVRRTLRLEPLDQTVGFVTYRLLTAKDAIEKHFAVTLNECEAPQFLRYRVGDFFVAHQDGNTGMLRLETESRLISTLIFLSRESMWPEADAFCGGSLVFSDLHNRFHVPAEPGMLVAFRAETTHEVTPLMDGERYSIAAWFR